MFSLVVHLKILSCNFKQGLCKDTSVAFQLAGSVRRPINSHYCQQPLTFLSIMETRMISSVILPRPMNWSRFAVYFVTLTMSLNLVGEMPPATSRLRADMFKSHTHGDTLVELCPWVGRGLAQSHTKYTLSASVRPLQPGPPWRITKARLSLTLKQTELFQTREQDENLNVHRHIRW